MGGLFSSKPAPAPAPTPVPAIPEPTIMPTPNDVKMRAAKKKSVAAQQKRGGRASTILTESDKLGG